MNTRTNSFHSWLKTHPHCSPEQTITAYNEWFEASEWQDDNYWMQRLIESIISDPNAIDLLHRLRCVYSYDDIVATAKHLPEDLKVKFRPIFKAAFALPPPTIEFPLLPLEPPAPTLTTENIDCVAEMLKMVCTLPKEMSIEAMSGFRKIYHKELLGKAAAKLNSNDKSTVRELVNKSNG